MNSQVENILKKIEHQEKFEQENPSKISHSEKVLAIGRDTGIFYNILLKSIVITSYSIHYTKLYDADKRISKSKVDFPPAPPLLSQFGQVGHLSGFAIV